MYVCLLLYVNVCMCASPCICVHLFVNNSICKCMFLHVWVYTVCTYICMCMYMHAHIFMIVCEMVNVLRHCTFGIYVITCNCLYSEICIHYQ